MKNDAVLIEQIVAKGRPVALSGADIGGVVEKLRGLGWEVYMSGYCIGDEYTCRPPEKPREEQ